MVHANDMTQWETIACTEKHETHATRHVKVDLGREHGYFDYPPVPSRLARAFEIEVWDWERYLEVPRYCPAKDAVSETIATLGIWEPIETTLVLSACEAGDGAFCDFGAQIGWFSMLAASCGNDVFAYEADPQVAELLARNVPTATVAVTRIGDETPPVLPEGPISLAKIDVEGAEPEVLSALVPRIMDGDVEHLLIEISPVFHDRYPVMVAGLVAHGYEAYRLPDKSQPPAQLSALPRDLAPGRIDTLPPAELHAMVAGWHQENLWFARPGARWA